MDNTTKGNEKNTRRSEQLTTLISLILLGIGLYFLFVTVDAWAVKTFARPILAAALIAAVDIHSTHMPSPASQMGVSVPVQTAQSSPQK